jgi:hypothetical protein
MPPDHSGVPSRYIIRGYLRRQDANQRALRDDVRDTLFDEWKAAYCRGKLRDDALDRLSSGFEHHLRQSGGFSVYRSIVQPTRAAPFRHRHSVSAFLGAPMTLGRNWWHGPEKASREPALMIDFCRMDFAPKRALFGLGFTGLVLTRHLLERIYERTEVSADAFEQLLHDHLDEFITGASLAEAAGLWLAGDSTFSRMTAVPYANGVMIVSNRILWGSSDDGEFGFRVAVPSGKMTSPFINRSSLITQLPDGRHLSSTAQIGVLTCGITYLDFASLRDEQLDYYYAFQALKEAIGQDYVAASIYCYIAPQLSQDHAVGVELPNSAAGRIARVRSLLSTWLETRDYDPMCLALPYEE